MIDKYILVYGKPTPCDDLMAWAQWFEVADRIVQRDIVGDVAVSTVFLGMDHSFGQGAPVLWETMIFGGQHDHYQERYSPLAAARAGHAKALARITP